MTPSPDDSARATPAAPRVSVVMTVYNSECYLAEAVESVLTQTFSDFELIVIDDGSADGSLPILRQFEKRDRRVRVVSRPNTGIVGAANEGIGLARAEYLARMDSDDVSLPRRFEKQVRYLDAHPECVIVGCRVVETEPHGIPVSTSGHLLSHEEIDAQLLTAGGGWALVQPATMMRTAAVRAVGGYRGKYNISEDHDLFLRLAERGKVANLPDVLFKYRRRFDGATQSHLHQLAEAKERLLREAHQRRGLPLPPDWKPDVWTPVEPARQLRTWGWAALKAGNVKAARKHAAAALRRAPFSAEAWRLMYCALRGM